MEKISFNKFSKALTRQPFFIWHDFGNDDEIDEISLKFDLPGFIDVAETSMSEIQAKSFDIIEKKFKKAIDSDGAYFLKSKSMEDKIIETQNAMNDNAVNIIFEPVFKYEYKNHEVIGSCKFYDKKTKTANFLKLSTSTKVKDILPIIFNYWVMIKNGIKIDDVNLFILATKDYKKGQVGFFKTKYINSTKSGRSPKSEDKYDYIYSQLLKSGNAIKSNGDQYEVNSIYQMVKEGKIAMNKSIFYFQDFENYLDIIIAAINENKLTYPQPNDNSFLAENNDWKELLIRTNNDWQGFSGRLVPKKYIIEKMNIKEIIDKSTTLENILKGKIIVNDSAKVKSILKKLLKKVVWYDFEAFSLPFSPMDGVLPFQQLVSQVSVIRTDNERELYKENIVIDPKKMSLDDFTKIIDKIYQENYYYVVFNKGYENTRLKEMIHLLKQGAHPRIDDLENKVEEIIDNTIDLADFFTSTAKKMPIILIPELKGNYSIKLIEKYITKNVPDLPYKIREYKTLEIQNGLMAMETANNRAMGIIGENEWKEKVRMLQEYCENDVRAMIMVYYLIKKIANKNMPNQ